MPSYPKQRGDNWPMIELEVIQADVTKLELDAIANAANTQLRHGGGVAAAIARAGGAAVQRESNEKAPIGLGEAVETTAGDMPARYVIHAATMELGGPTSSEIITASHRIHLAEGRRPRVPFAGAGGVRHGRRRFPARSGRTFDGRRRSPAPAGLTGTGRIRGPRRRGRAGVSSGRRGLSARTGTARRKRPSASSRRSAPARQSTLITVLTRGARAATASTARCTTAITSSQVSPSITVNIESVLLGSPESRTTRTASATISPTPSPTPSGVTENATSTDIRRAYLAASSPCGFWCNGSRQRRCRSTAR